MIIPFFAPLNAAEVNELRAQDDVGIAASTLLESLPDVVDIDKVWPQVQEVLEQVGGSATLAIYGSEMLSADPGVSVLSPSEVGEVTDALGHIDPDLIEDAGLGVEDALEVLEGLYTRAAKEGQSVVIVWN